MNAELQGANHTKHAYATELLKSAGEIVALREMNARAVQALEQARIAAFNITNHVDTSQTCSKHNESIYLWAEDIAALKSPQA